MSNENLEKENSTSLVNPTSYFIVENDELVDSSVVNNFTRGRGIKVLVVDDDVTCLSIITKYLNLYQYQVISKSNPVEALNLLEKNEEKINLLLTDVCMEDVDGFKLLEVAKKHDIPVIMMSGYNDEDIVMKGVKYGARNHLLKPIKLTDVQHIWQHVLRNNLEKGINNKIDCDNEDHRRDNIIIKKSGNRVRWNDDLHRDFVSVVESLGGEDKAVPKKILEVLNGKYGYLNLTREQVASHLQKYRKNLSKHKNNDSNKGVTTSSIMDHSFMVPNPVHSDQFTSPIVSHRHHLPVAPHLQNYPQLNNHPHSMINNYVVVQPQQQPQPLQVRPSQMIMQPMMQFGRNNLMGSNKLPQVNYHQQQQQQQAQPLMNFGDLGSMHMNNSFDSDPVMPVQDEEFNASLIINPTTNIFLNDGNNHNWGNDFSKSS